MVGWFLVLKLDYPSGRFFGGGNATNGRPMTLRKAKTASLAD